MKQPRDLAELYLQNRISFAELHARLYEFSPDHHDGVKLRRILAEATSANWARDVLHNELKSFLAAPSPEKRQLIDAYLFGVISSTRTLLTSASESTDSMPRGLLSPSKETAGAA